MVEITPEVRRAVLSEVCEKEGHQIDFQSAWSFEKGVLHTRDDLKFPHLRCARCGATWIVLPTQGYDYEDAERNLFQHLDARAEFSRKIARNRVKRQERDRPEELRPAEQIVTESETDKPRGRGVES